MSRSGREKFELKSEPAVPQPPLPLNGTLPRAGGKAQESGRRRKDSARLVWDSKPKGPPSPRDIEFQTAEVIPNSARDAGTLPHMASLPPRHLFALRH